MFFKALYLFMGLVPAMCMGQQPFNINYTVNSGLPSSENYFVFQDSKGYIWVSGDAGVARFNGTNFTVFTSENGLVDNTVFNMAEDRLGRIWCLTLSGRVCYFHNNKFNSIPANDSLSQIVAGDIIKTIIIEDDQTIYLGLVQPTMVKIKFPYTKHDIECFSYNDQTTSTVIVKNKIAIPFQSTEKKNGLTKKLVIELKHQKLSFQKIIHYSMHRRTAVSGNNIYVSFGTLILRITGNKIAGSISTHKPVISLYVDKKGHLWAGMINGGINVIEGDLSAQRNYFPNESISCITGDHEGGIWATSLKNGLYHLPYPDVIHFSDPLAKDNKTMALAAYGTTIVAGKTNGELVLINRETQKMERLKLSNPVPDAHDNAVNNIYIHDTDSSLLLLAHTSMVYDIKNRRPRVYLKIANHASFFKSARAYENGSFIAAAIVEMHVYDSKYKETDSIRFNQARINSIATEGKRVWLATTKGLYLYHKPVFYFYGDTAALLRNRIEDIEVTRNGTLIMATKANGLQIFDTHKKKIHVLNAANGLCSNTCRDLFVENDSILWVCTNNGLDEVNYRTRHVLRHYSSANGLPSNEVNKVVITGNEIWVATTNGICSIPKNESFSNTVPPLVYIQGFFVNGRFQKKGAPLIFRHHQNDIEIRFESTGYKTSEKKGYIYRFKNLEKNWHFIQEPYIRFSSLSPGIYTFELYAINSSGLRSLKPAVISFEIMYPFWLRAWFIVLCLLVISALISLVFVFRVRKIRRKEEEKAAIDKKMAKAEMKALRAQMNPHFIFNSMNSIQHFILVNDNDSAHKYLVKFSRLIRSVLENSKTDLVTIRQELDTLQTYIDLEALRMADKIDYRVTIDKRLDPDHYMVPPLIIQPYAENAIWHGLLPKEGEKKLDIEITLTNNKILMIVEDNGVGRHAAVAHKTQPFHKKSYGMQITGERLEVLNYIYKTNISVLVLDKKDVDNQPAGTRIELSMPLIKKTK